MAVADEPEEPDEFLFHSDGFRKKKLVDVIRESLGLHPARPPHQIWLPPLEISEPIDALVARWRGRPWHVDYGQNPGLVFPLGIVDIPEEHAQRVHAIDAEMDNVMVVATAQRGKSTTLMTLMTSAALMYRPERVTFFCIGASLYPVEELPHVASVCQPDRQRGSVTDHRSIEGLIMAREASFKRYQIDISEFRERRFGMRRRRRLPIRPTTNSATSSSSSTTSATSTTKTPQWENVPSRSPAKVCRTGCTS